MDIRKIINNFINDCSTKISLDCILEFGSSTYDKNPHDIDLAFFIKENIFSIKEIFNLLNLIKKYEKKYNDLVFDFSGFDRKRKAKHSVTIVVVDKSELSILQNPHDIFFYRNLSMNKEKRILYGKDFISKMEFNLTNAQKYIILNVDIKRCLRRSLDDDLFKLESAYFLFKSTLRLMLTNYGNPKKEELIALFKKEYNEKIILPPDSTRILSHDLRPEDFKNILKFSENSLRYLLTSV